MKQFKAERQNRLSSRSVEEDNTHTLDHLITQHNALCEHLAETIITLPKPEFWSGPIDNRYVKQQAYLQALSDASKAFGVIIKLGD